MKAWDMNPMNMNPAMQQNQFGYGGYNDPNMMGGMGGPNDFNNR